MTTLTITRGLPASGKSRWAAQTARTYGAWRVSRDSIREMLAGDLADWTHGDGAAEDIVTQIQIYAVRRALTAGRDVIVDDCNLDDEYAARFKGLATECGAEFEIQDFRHIPLDVCLKRDQQRKQGKRVGAVRIFRMFRKYIAPGPRLT